MNHKASKQFTWSAGEWKITAILDYCRKDFYLNGIHKSIELIDITDNKELKKGLKFAGALKSPPQILFGEVYFNLPEAQKHFALYHEVGHIFLDHNDKERNLEQELEADSFSLSITKNSTAAIDFLNFILNSNQSKDNEEIRKRIQNVYDFQTGNL